MSNVTKLIKTDVDENNNKFWQATLNDDGSVLCEWGRVGGKGQSKTFSGGQSYIDKKVREKERKGYKKIDFVGNFEKTTEKVISSSNLKNAAKSQIQYSSKLVEKFIDELVKQNRHQIMEASGDQITINKDGLVTTVLGDVLKLETIKNARKTLKEINKFIKKKDFDSSEFKSSINDYLTLVPHKVGSKKGWHKYFIVSQDDVVKHNTFLDSLENSISVAEERLKKSSDNPETPEENKIFDLSIDLEEDRDILNWVDKFYNKTRQNIHTSARLSPNKVFKIKIGHVNEGFESYGSKLDNQWDLWHGTNTSNLLSILHKGLVMPSECGVAHGSMFGPGIYFSDQSTKSLNYSYGYWSGGRNSVCHMFIAKVAMGNIKVPRGPISKKPEKGYDSYFAKAQQSGVMNNEMIVFDTRQINLNYIVQFS